MPSCQISGYLPTYLRARSGSWLSTTFPLDISNEYSRDQTVRQISYYNSYVDRVSMSGPARKKTSLYAQCHQTHFQTQHVSFWVGDLWETHIQLYQKHLDSPESNKCHWSVTNLALVKPISVTVFWLKNLSPETMLIPVRRQRGVLCDKKPQINWYMPMCSPQTIPSHARQTCINSSYIATAVYGQSNVLISLYIISKHG